MHLVDDIYLILAHGRQIGGFIAQVTDVIHAVVGGGINFRYIQNGALINAFADSTFTAGVRAGGIQAVDRFGKNFGAGGFAGAAGAGKQVGMANAPGGDLVLQGRYDGFLANNIRKLARTPLAVQCAVHQSHLPAKTVKRRAEHAAALLGVQMQACRGTVQTLLNAARFPA